MSAELLCTTRNGVVERLERGHAVVCDATGTVAWAAGDIDHVTFMRSSAKPIQATALVLSGAIERFGLSRPALAVACGSHHGEPGHVRAALELLEYAKISPTALQCGIHEPWVPESLRLAGNGVAASPVQNNCSGKHAGMLAAARAIHAPLESYLEPHHPIQVLIRHNLAAFAGISQANLTNGVDGCSAPNYALPIRHIARTFAQFGAPLGMDTDLARASERIRAAMSTHPWFVQGTGGLDTALMSAGAGTIISKGGAEGLLCVALPVLGLGVAVKFESGRGERMGSLVIALLQALRALPATLPAQLAAFDRPVVRNHRGIITGETCVLVDTVALTRVTAGLTGVVPS